MHNPSTSNTQSLNGSLRVGQAAPVAMAIPMSMPMSMPMPMFFTPMTGALVPTSTALVTGVKGRSM